MVEAARLTVARGAVAYWLWERARWTAVTAVLTCRGRGWNRARR